MADETAVACVSGQIASGLVDCTTDVSALDSRGRWVVVIDFEGTAQCLRFSQWHPGSPADVAHAWRGPSTQSYVSSLDRGEYIQAVEKVRDSIADGTLYQANICRVLDAGMPDPDRADVMGLAALLELHNRAPYASSIRVPSAGIEIASASPELYLGRKGRSLRSGPIKGTARTAEELTAKDRAENVMIVDLVRNDLSRIAEPGSVTVPSLLRIEEHPTVVHLVSTVAANVAAGIGWAQIIDATFPPGSVSGAPKFTALQAIEELEPLSRGPYCGAIGVVDADTSDATLAVGIRTFWLSGTPEAKTLHFGTGAGITWGSNPDSEWEESELKARHLTSVASKEWA